jgi:S-layer protein
MVTADAVIAGGSAAFATAVTGFEVLTLTGSTGAESVDLASLGGFQKATSSASAGTLTLNNFANGGTLTVTADTAGEGYILAVKDAATGTADVVKLVLSKAGALTTGTVTAADVETVTIAANDTTSSVAAGTNTHTLVLSATAATSLVVTGNANLNLDNTGNTAVTSIDASAMTGALTVTTAGTIAETVKGGSGRDVLTAAAGTVADNLQGGGGDDTLTANNGLSILTGGAGSDLFVVVASLNVNGYATITDLSSADLIQFLGADSFQTSKVSLGDTAVFQDYANSAVNAVGADDLAWFQFAGNTYVVMDYVAGGGIDSTVFINGEDLIVRLTGLIDLRLASFNDTFDTIAL